MKTFISLLLGLCLSAPLFAQQDSAAQKFPPEELDKLVAPIALYPDSLIALILPSATTSSDVVLAARYIADNGDPSAIDNEPWSDSVKSLAHYPVVVQWMDDNLSWTRQMGAVFEAQPADVMESIQRMRAQARAEGLLADTPQQKVVMQESEICIVPAEPDVIYVPRYDPEILWMHRPHYGSYMTFGVGFSIGSWLYFDCDWPGRGIWVQHRNPGWVYHPGWRRPANDVRVVIGSAWHPDPRRIHPGRPTHPLPLVAVHPRGMDEPHRDFHGRPELHFPGRPDDRPGHVMGPAQGRRAPMPAQHDATPSPAARPHQVAGPQSQPPRDFQRERQEGGNRASPQTPRPPSHTPVASPAPQHPASAPAPVAHPSSGGVVPAPHREAAPSPAAKPSGRDGDDDKPGRLKR